MSLRGLLRPCRIKHHQNNEIHHWNHKYTNSCIEVSYIPFGYTFPKKDAMMIKLLYTYPTNATVRSLSALLSHAMAARPSLDS